MRRLASSIRAIRINIVKSTGQSPPSLCGIKTSCIRAARIKETIPAAKETRNQGKVTSDFLYLNQKKTIKAGRAELSVNIISIHIPCIIVIYYRIVSAFFVHVEGFMNRIILITGPKHSGKSTSAKALAELTKGEIYDLDKLIEAQTGETARELYASSVEAFRKAEAAALHSVIDQQEDKKQEANQQEAKDQAELDAKKIKIIAAVGGLVDNAEAMALLSRSLHGDIITVYLDVSAETAWQRIMSDRELPAFLEKGDPMVDNPRDFHPLEIHQALHKRRAEAYKALADVIIFAENKTPVEIAEKIVRFLSML